MPNHIHFLFKPLNEWSAKKICNNFLSFTAHKIIKDLKCLSEDASTEQGEINSKNLLEFFKSSAKDLNDREYKVWQDVLVKIVIQKIF